MLHENSFKQCSNYLLIIRQQGAAMKESIPQQSSMPKTCNFTEKWTPAKARLELYLQTQNSNLLKHISTTASE